MGGEDTVTTKRMQDELMQTYSRLGRNFIIPNGIIVGKMRRGGCRSDQARDMAFIPLAPVVLFLQDEHGSDLLVEAIPQVLEF